MKKCRFIVALIFLLPIIQSYALPEWNRLDAGYPPYSEYCPQRLVYDEGHGRVVFLMDGTLWEWDGKDWLPIPTENEPPYFWDTRLIYDRSRSVLVLWGGNQVWELQTNRWVKREAEAAPPERHSPVWFYDTVQGVAHLMGGYSSAREKYLNDHWSWDGSNWNLEDAVTTGPFPGYVIPNLVAFDENQGSLLIGKPVHELSHNYYHMWEWDGTTWKYYKSEVGECGYYLSDTFLYDPVVKKVRRFPYGEKWEGQKWKPNFNANLPGTNTEWMSSFPSASFDRKRNRLVYINGSWGDQGTWEWDERVWRLKIPTETTVSDWCNGIMFFDYVRSEMLLLNEEGELYSWKQNHWEPKYCTDRPRLLYGRKALTLDENTSHTILLCETGKYPSEFQTETWEWDGTDWTQDFPTTHPRLSWSSALVFDYARKNVVLLGTVTTGEGESHETHFEQWVWSGTDWQCEFPRTTPGFPYRNAVVSDPDKNVIHSFTFSFPPGGAITYEHWIWDGNDWRRLPDKTLELNVSTPFNVNQSYYNIKGGQPVLFTSNYTTMTRWLWDGSELVSEQEFPHPGYYKPFLSKEEAYYPLHNSILLNAPYRRTLTMTFEITTGSIELRVPDFLWPDTSYSPMCYDPEHKMILLQGGTWKYQHYCACCSPSPETWLWNGRRWQWKWDIFAPYTGYGFGLTYDFNQRQVVLFGGERCEASDIPVRLNETWCWNGSAWRQLMPPISPPPRNNPAITYNKYKRVVVLFGGETTSPPYFYYEDLNDTWFWDGETWHQANPTTPPSPRAGAVMAYDEAHREIVLYGGEGADYSTLHDTWTFDGTNWRQRFPAHPPDFTPADMVFNRARCRVTLFGANTDKILEWNGRDWLPLNVPDTPTFSQNCGFTYDTDKNAIIIYGAKGKPWYPSSYHNSTWMLKFSPKNGVSAERIISHLLGVAPFREDELSYADVNHDGIVSVADLIFLLTNQ